MEPQIPWSFYALLVPFAFLVALGIRAYLHYAGRLYRWKHNFWTRR